MTEAMAERIASSLETIATRLGEPDRQLAARVAHFEGLLKEHVALIENPNSTDQAWAELLADTKAALEGEPV